MVTIRNRKPLLSLRESFNISRRVLFSFIYNSSSIVGQKAACDELAENFRSIMSEDFNLQLEDESEIRVARTIYELFFDCVRGGTKCLEALKQIKQQQLELNVVDQSAEFDMSADEDEDEEEECAQ